VEIYDDIKLTKKQLEEREKSENGLYDLIHKAENKSKEQSE
jgi:hypothetical protein